MSGRQAWFLISTVLIIVALSAGIGLGGNLAKGTSASGTSIPISKGGTGATTAPAALQNLLPDFTGNDGKVLGLASGTPAWLTQTGSGSGGMIPDYVAIENTNLISTNGGTWTADRTGYVQVSFSGTISTYDNTHVLIDETPVWHDSETLGGTATGRNIKQVIPVAAGQVVKLTWESGGGTISASCYFIPPKFITPIEPVIAENFANYQAVPDYDKQEATDRSSTTGWTVEKNGFVNISVRSWNPDSRVAYINDKRVLNSEVSMSGYAVQDSGTFPVEAGDVVKVTYTNSTYGTSSVYFIPAKFVQHVAPVVEPGYDYSTDEKPVMIIEPGGTQRQKQWVDGKPIYERTFQQNLTNWSVGGVDSSPAISVAGNQIDNVVDWKTSTGSLSASTGWAAPGITGIANTNGILTWNFTTGINPGKGDWYVTLQYTKTD